MRNSLDHQVILNFNNGDKRAFEQVFKAYHSPLVTFAHKLTGHLDEAEDAATEAFLKLFEKRSQFKTENSIKAFLYVTVRNRCLNFLKGKKTHDRIHIEIANYLENDTWLEYQYTINAGVVELINQAIEELPTECQKIFKLLFYEELKPAEIAVQLQISTNTVYVQKSRALHLLRLKLGDELK